MDILDRLNWIIKEASNADATVTVAKISWLEDGNIGKLKCVANVATGLPDDVAHYLGLERSRFTSARQIANAYNKTFSTNVALKRFYDDSKYGREAEFNCAYIPKKTELNFTPDRVAEIGGATVKHFNACPFKVELPEL